MSIEPTPLISEKEAGVLLDLALEVLPDEEIVELGSWAGTSAKVLCQGEAHLTCIDPWEDWIDPPPGQWPVDGAEAFRQFTAAVDQRNTLALCARSVEIAPFWSRPVGLLFIDASHTFDDAVADYETWSGFIPPGGVLAIHDYIPEPTAELWWAEGPTRAVDEVVVPSGLWEPLGVTEWLWTGRRV